VDENNQQNQEKLKKLKKYHYKTVKRLIFVIIALVLLISGLALASFLQIKKYGDPCVYCIESRDAIVYLKTNNGDLINFNNYVYREFFHDKISEESNFTFTTKVDPIELLNESNH